MKLFGTSKSRKTAMVLTIVFYLVSLIAAFIGIKEHIKNKDYRMRSECWQQIKAAFNNHERLIDVAYSGERVEYEKVETPHKYKDGLMLSLQGWNSDEYEDLYKLYRLKWLTSKWKYSTDNKDGWNLAILKKDYGNFLYAYNIFPYAVGYKKQSDYYMYNYMPSVQEAVDATYKYFKEEDKGGYAKDFEEGCFNKVFSQIGNDYYSLREDSVPRSHWTFVNSIPMEQEDEKIYGDNKEKMPQRETVISNGFWKVFIARTPIRTWSITRIDWRIEADKHKLWKHWGIALTLLMLFILLPLVVIETQKKKIKNESLYNKLLRLCNPSNFMQNYNKDKVDKANAIYKELLITDKNDLEHIHVLSAKAINELNIEIMDKEEIRELLEKVNPKNFMNPYNAEKFELANNLYARLSQGNLTFQEFENIKVESKKLFEK